MVLYVTRVAEPSHFDGYGSGAPKTGNSGSGFYCSTAPAPSRKQGQSLFSEQNFKISRIFVCIILGRSRNRSRRYGFGSQLRLRNPAKNYAYLIKKKSFKVIFHSGPQDDCFSPSSGVNANRYCLTPLQGSLPIPALTAGKHHRRS